MATNASTSTAPSDPVPSTSTTPTKPEHTHYLLTLKRSPLHLPKQASLTCKALGLSHRLSTTLVPISPETAGAVLKVKELLAVKLVSPFTEENMEKGFGRSERIGEEGKQGSGMRFSLGGGIIRVGSERCNGEERGYRRIL